MHPLLQEFALIPQMYASGVDVTPMLAHVLSPADERAIISLALHTCQQLVEHALPAEQ
jgi:hypothetical protein